MSGIEARTGRLFGDLWHKLDDEQFEQSVALFGKRFEVRFLKHLLICLNRFRLIRLNRLMILCLQ